MTDSIPDGGKLHADSWSTEQEAALLQTSERKRQTYGRIIHGLRIGALGVFGEVPSDQTDGLTDDQIRIYLGRFGKVSKSGPATRRGELVEMGLVRPQRLDPDAHTDTSVGPIVKRPSDLGNSMIVWELVPGDEYVAPVSTERQPKAKAANVARIVADWESGDSSLADKILRAYLNPEVVSAELRAQQAEF